MNDATKIILFSALTFILIIISSNVLALLYGIPSGNVAIVYINSEVVSFSSYLESGQTSDSIISLLESAQSNPNVEAVVLSINSPGGHVVACKEVSNYVLNMTKPVIAWIREIGTSGAYLIASSADYIISDELSIVGSIGSTMSYLEFSETMTKYGVEYARLVSGDYKDMGSVYKNMTIGEKEIFMQLINESFEYFLNQVVTSRNLSSESAEIISDGRIMTGLQAYSLGLVDELGSKPAVIRRLNSLNITDLTFEDYTTTDFFSGLGSIIGLSTTSSFPTYNLTCCLSSCRTFHS